MFHIVRFLLKNSLYVQQGNTHNKNKLTPDIVFTGDSLIHGYPVITRLPSGSKKDYNTITKPYLDSLPDDVLVMPGHGDWGKKGVM